MYYKIKLPMIAAIAAFVVTVGTTAFTKVSNPPATYTFAYQGTDFSQAKVESVTNWAIGSPGCNNVDNKACEIEVNSLYTHIDPISQEPVLNESGSDVLDIQTGTNNQTDYFVTPSTGITAITNKQ